MNLARVLSLAGVPSELHAEAIACFDRAQRDHPSHLRKHFVRWFRAGKIASLLEWGDERLLDRNSDLAAWDIAPVRNVTANGDNLPWDETGPITGAWLDKNPESVDYQLAVQRNYWLPGTHPRSPEARKAWYRRNACEFTAWELGCPVGTDVQEWTANGITVLRSGDAWQIRGIVNWLGPIRLKIDIGYEVGNVFAKMNGKWVQSWYPLPTHELRACVVWVIHPTLGGAS